MRILKRHRIQVIYVFPLTLYYEMLEYFVTNGVVIHPIVRLSFFNSVFVEILAFYVLGNPRLRHCTT
jgi:hypothetical protein